MKLTDTQLVLLSAASQREDGGVEPGPNLKGYCEETGEPISLRRLA